MRSPRDMHSHLAHPRTVLAAASVAVVGLLLAACAGDAPTAVGSSTDNDTPDVTTADLNIPAGNHAGTTATHSLIKTLPTVQLMQGKEGNVASSGASTNSPWDMTFFGGPVVTGARSWNIYVNCTTTPAQCWGTGNLTPASYLVDLNISSLIQVDNQYNDENNAGKYSVSQLKTTYTFTDHTAQMSDIFEIVYAATVQTGDVGYDNIYHVFLPQGTDMCMSATECYSPDNSSTFVFCAFHGSVDLPSGHALYTVEPYQAVSGCPLPTQTRVIDATASTLSHEFFETISDPDLNAWFNALTGNEMSDECFGFRFPNHVGQHTYVVQEEYSNQIQDCTNGGH